MQKSTHSTTWCPEFIYCSSMEGKVRLKELSDAPGIFIFDEIESQLSELIELSDPQKVFEPAEISEAVFTHLGSISLDEYGVWVYYSWSNRLVHLLEEDEFVKLRTNRNQNKITSEEQGVLATKKVGLIGLSVGSSIALTMAMERGFGELRLADFDDLELTNLNRIKTGVHNLGLSKVICTAREIMEIDPFLKLICFTDGITHGNIDAFLTEGGKLDLLIDECDSLEIKLISRFKARELGIPVVMETSDRGMLDVERFDLEQDRPILHGLIEELTLEKLNSIKSKEEMMPYMMAMVGFEGVSLRMKESIPEIGKTIKTWPQLASAVTLGGGVVTDVSRRVFLDSFRESGRFYMDIDQIINQ